MKIKIQVKPKKATQIGGTRIIESVDENKEIIVDSENNPITEKIVMPKIEGAIIIAEGGDNAVIKTNIIQAVSAVTGLSTHKIQVFKMSKWMHNLNFIKKGKWKNENFKEKSINYISNITNACNSGIFKLYNHR